MRTLAAAAVLLAMGQPPVAHPPRGPAANDVALGKLVYAAPGTFWAPGAKQAQAGLQRLTDGILAGRAGVNSRETIVIAPYTADLPELPLAAAPDRATLATASGFLDVDLGGIYQLTGLALEADASGDYRVEGSREGRFWRSLWTAPAAFGDHGFVVRRSAGLPAGTEARYLRVSGANAYGLADRPETFPGERKRVLYAVTELEAFSSQSRPLPDNILPGFDRP